MTTLVHRWLGALLCLLFVVWFASGMVMVFADYPQVEDGERLASLPRLPTTAALQSAAMVMPRADLGSATLTTVRGRAAWRFEDGAVLFADDGAAMAPLTAREAADEIARRLGLAVDAAHATRVVTADQWTLYASMRSQLPAWRFEVGDAAGTEVYVSERTAEIIQQTTRRERVLAWLGPIPHWLYPAALVRHRGFWRDVVIALSLMGAVSCVLGLVVGVWSWRVRPRGSTSAGSPYRSSWMRWHHVLGLIFGMFAFTWALSGALSLNPTRWSPGPYPAHADADRLAGGSVAADTDPVEALRACAGDEGHAPRELELIALGGTSYAVCRWAPERTRIVRLDDGLPQPELTVEAIRDAVARGWPEIAIVAVERRVEPDAYHYPTHREPSFRPYVRVRLGNRGDTTLYVDPFEGRLLRRHTTRSRIERWLYHGLHSLDVPFLYRHRWLWRCVVLVLLAAGLLLSVTAVVLTIRWMRRARHLHLHRRIRARVRSRNEET